MNKSVSPVDVEQVNAYSRRYSVVKNESREKVGEYVSNHADNVWLSWSGGKDSTALLLLCVEFSPHIPVVFFHSGLEYPENVTYISDIAKKLNLNLHTIHPKEDAFTVLHRSGMWIHHTTREEGSGKDLKEGAGGGSVEERVGDDYFHTVLIKEPSLRACEMFGFYNLTGLRTEESQGRRIMLSKNGGEYVTGGFLTTLCPLWQWSSLDVRTFLWEKNVPPNPVYEKLNRLHVPEWQQRVGMIFDGNALETGRLVHVKNGWPELWAELVKNFPRIEEWT